VPLRLIPILLALAWGLNWPAVKIALGEWPPFTLRLLGLGSAALLLLALARWQGRPLRLRPQDGPALVIGGLLAIAAFNHCTAWAQLSTSTSRAAVLTFTMPMMTALLSRLWLGERLQPRQAWALAIGTAGVALLARPVLASWADDGTAHALRGLLLPLLAAFGWAAGTVLLQRWPPTGDRVVLTAWQLALGAACGGLGALLAGEPPPAWPPSPRVALALAFHIGPATALAYWAWFELSGKVSATVSSLTTLMVPVVGVLGAMALVGDRPGLHDGAGFMLVLTGAAMAQIGLRAR
jgi:drug/metabolite transporter (DMT)-like permease